MYEFNLITDKNNVSGTRKSFGFDKHEQIYKMDKYGDTYFLTDDECRLIIKAGGLDSILKFLKETKYTDKIEVNGILIVNLTV